METTIEPTKSPPPPLAFAVCAHCHMLVGTTPAKQGTRTICAPCADEAARHVRRLGEHPRARREHATTLWIALVLLAAVVWLSVESVVEGVDRPASVAGGAG